MKKPQHSRAAVKASDAKSHERKMKAKHGHKHPVVMGGVNDSGSLTAPKPAPKSSNALRGR